jgi:hypothetical protein
MPEAAAAETAAARLRKFAGDWPAPMERMLFKAQPGTWTRRDEEPDREGPFIDTYNI